MNLVTFTLLISLQFVALVYGTSGEAPQNQVESGSVAAVNRQQQPNHSPPDDSANSIGLEPRLNDRNFIKDIVDRLHSLDADIGKLINNSTTMYSAPSDPSAEPQEVPAAPKAGGE